MAFIGLIANKPMGGFASSQPVSDVTQFKHYDRLIEHRSPYNGKHSLNSFHRWDGANR